MLSGSTAGRTIEPYDITTSERGRGAPPRPRSATVLFHGNGLGEISGLVHVAAEADRDVVGQELERYGHQDGREQLGGDRHSQHARGARADLAVALVREGDDAAVPRP